ncbi:hypothetical protein [Streptomyces sp. NPDC001226]
MDEHEQRGVQAANANEQGDHGDEVEQAGLLPSDPVARTVPQFMVYQPASRRGAAPRKGDPQDVAVDGPNAAG